MRVGEVLAQTFTIYRANFPAFFALFALVEMPFALLSLVFREASATLPRPLSPLAFPSSPVHSLAALANVQIILLHALFAGPLMEGAAVRASLDAIAGHKTDIRRSYRAAVGLFWPLFLSTALTLMAAAVGFALLVIPGVMVLLWFSLAVPTIMAEGVGPVAALRRSRELVRGHLLQIFALVLLLSASTGLVEAVAHGLAATLPLASATLANGLVTVLVSPIASLAMALVYVHLGAKR